MRFVYILLTAALFAAATVSPAHSSATYEDISDFGPIDRESGWLLTSDRLYLTRDVGATWRTVAPALLPGEHLLAADFIPSGAGWIVLGRPLDDERSALRLAHASDWGATWTYSLLTLFDENSDPTIARVELNFASEREGVLRVRHASSSNFERWSAWRTADGGDTWESVSPAAPSVPGARFMDERTGWRLERNGECSDRGDARACKQVLMLGATDDGGQTWRSVSLPDKVAAAREFTVAQGGAVNAASLSSRTMAVTGQGFDKCEVATLGQFYDWRMNSPYSASNLYIGGSKRACSNRPLSADYLRSIASIGWTFIPTWVGPQSPCYAGGNGGISRDPATAESQGWAEAQAAADTALQLGLTEPDGSGTIIYYDMEYYNTSDGVCNAAVQAFVTGWVNGLRARGNLAGVYGIGSTLKLLANLNPPPNAIWAAHWVYKEYTPEATVWDVYSLSNGLWVNQQRLRQYTGGHNETWGGSALNIDSNVLNGPVAFTDTYPATATPTPPPTATPTRIPFTPVAWHYLPMLLR